MTTFLEISGPPPVGILGSVIGHVSDEPWWIRHRVGTLLFFCLVATTINHGVRVLIPYFAKNFPLTMAYSKLDILKLVAIDVVILLLYLAAMGTGQHPRFKEDFVQAHRFSLTVAMQALYTIIYGISYVVLKKRLPADQAKTQAANVIRIGVKTSLFAYWCLSGDFIVVLTTHPLELTAEKYWHGALVQFGINTLYMWELLFRELRPVNVIHHAIACIGFTSVLEWSHILEPTRVCTTVPTVGSLIETFVCMGSLAYRFMPKDKTLAKVLFAITIFVLVSYNLLLAAYVSVLFGYLNFYSFWYGYVAMPALVPFTYPAQMNMAKVFYSLYKKTAREAKQAAVTVVENVEAPKPTEETRVDERRQ